MGKTICKFTIKNYSGGYKPREYYYYDEITLSENSFSYILKQDEENWGNIDVCKNDETSTIVGYSTYPYKNIQYRINWAPYKESFKRLCYEITEIINSEEIKNSFSTDVGIFTFIVFYDDNTKDTLEVSLPNDFFAEFFIDIKQTLDQFFFDVPNMLDLGCYDYPTIENDPNKKYYFPGFGDEHTLSDYIESTKPRFLEFGKSIKRELLAKNYDDDVVDKEIDNFSDVILDTYLDKYDYKELMRRLEYMCGIGMKSKEKEHIVRNDN